MYVCMYVSAYLYICLRTHIKRRQPARWKASFKSSSLEHVGDSFVISLRFFRISGSGLRVFWL